MKNKSVFGFLRWIGKCIKEMLPAIIVIGGGIYSLLAIPFGIAFKLIDGSGSFLLLSGAIALMGALYTIYLDD